MASEAGETLTKMRALFTWITPRFYAKSPGLTGHRMVGDCLRPFLLPDDIVFVDSTLDPVDGELVLVMMKYRTGGIMIGGRDARYKTMPAVKQLIIIDDEKYLACESDALSAEQHEILGPVVAWNRRGWRRASMSKLDFREKAVERARRSTGLYPDSRR